MSAKCQQRTFVGASDWQAKLVKVERIIRTRQRFFMHCDKPPGGYGTDHAKEGKKAILRYYGYYRPVSFPAG